MVGCCVVGSWVKSGVIVVCIGVTGTIGVTVVGSSTVVGAAVANGGVPTPGRGAVEKRKVETTNTQVASS